MQLSDLRHDLQQEHNNTLRTQNELSHSQKELEKYKSDHASLTEEKNGVEAKLKASIASVREADEREHNLKGEIDVKKQRADLLEEEVARERKAIEQMEVEKKLKVEEMLKDQEDSRKAHHQTVEELRQEIDTGEKEKRATEKKANETAMTLSHRDQELHSSVQKVSDLEATLNSVRKDLAEERARSESDQKTHREDHRESETKISKLEGELGSLRSTNSENQDALDQLKKDHSGALDSLKAVREEHRAAQDAADKASRDSHRSTEGLKRDIAELNNANERLTKAKLTEMDALSSKVSRLESSLETEKFASEKFKKLANETQTTMEENDTQFNIKLDKALAELDSEVQAKSQLSDELENLKQTNERQSTAASVDIEALNDELEEEKRRVSTATNEKTRVQAEVDGLKKKTERLNSELESAKSGLNSKNEESADLARELRSIKRKLELSAESAAEEKKRGDVAEEKLSELEAAKEGVAKELQDALKLHSDSLKEVVILKKGVQQAKDDSDKRHQDVASMKDKLETAEEQILEMKRSMGEKETEISKLLGEIVRIKEFEDSNEFMEGKLKKFEQEVERMLEDIGSSRKAQLQAESAVTEHQLKAQRFEDHTIALSSDLEAMGKETKLLRETLESVRATSTAKDEAADAARRKAEIAIAGKKALEVELEEMRSRLSEVGRSKRTSESEAMTARRECDAMAIELEETLNKLRRVEGDYAEAIQNVQVGEEVAVLRSQLSSMRNQLLGVEDDDWENGEEGTGSPRKMKLSQSAVLEHKREKEAYEVVISKVRSCEERSDGLRRRVYKLRHRF